MESPAKRPKLKMNRPSSELRAMEQVDMSSCKGDIVPLSVQNVDDIVESCTESQSTDSTSKESYDVSHEEMLPEALEADVNSSCRNQDDKIGKTFCALGTLKLSFLGLSRSMRM